MPWSDLSQVTTALTGLLDLNISLVLAPPPPVVTIVTTPPDQLGNNVTNTISLYLYHVRETAATQNIPGPGNDVPGISTSPFGLDLFYVLTAHHRVNVLFDAGIEQRLMGFALKTFHDYPVLTDATTVNGTPVYGPTIRGRSNRLNIELRKLEPDQALAIWTTGDRQFVRLAAYYQVGLVQLEPDPPRRMPGIVLSVGAFVTPFGGVSLTGSRSELQFDLPAAAGGGTQTLRAAPARPALTAPPGIHSALTLLGDNLSAGVTRRLVLRNARWQRLSPPADRVPLDGTLNAPNGWIATFHPDRVEVQVGNQVTFFPPGGGPPRTIDVFPGSYAVYVETVMDQKILAGELRSQSALSNEVAFSITPRIVNHAIQPANRIRVNLDPAFALNIGGPGVEPLEIQVVVDGEVYARRNAVGPFTARTFRPLANALVLDAHFPVATPGMHTVRITVDGADAQPYWVVIP